MKIAVNEHHRDLENNLTDSKEILTNLKEEIDTLRAKLETSTVASTPICSISEQLGEEVASLTKTLELIQTDGLSSQKAEVQHKLDGIQQEATKMATTITDLRAHLADITAKITSFNSQDITNEISENVTE